jgi:hypothetical protein
MSLALLVTNAAEEKSATSYPLRIPLPFPPKTSLLFSIRLQLQACIRSLAILLRHPGAAITSVLVGSILPHHGQPPFPKYLTIFITQKATSHATHAIKERRHQITAD